MASLRRLVSATTGDALADQEIRTVLVASVINLFASAVTVTDTISLRLGKTIVMDNSTANVSAAALGMVDTDRDQLIFNSVVGPGKLRLPCTVTASLIYLLSVEPILG